MSTTSGDSGIAAHISETNKSIQKHHELLKDLLKKIQVAHKVRGFSFLFPSD